MYNDYTNTNSIRIFIYRSNTKGIYTNNTLQSNKINHIPRTILVAPYTNAHSHQNS